MGNSVGGYAVPTQKTPLQRVPEGIVPGRTLGAVEDAVPARTLDAGNTHHSCLTLRADGARRALDRRGLPRDGRRLGSRRLRGQELAAATQVVRPLPTTKAAVATGLDEAFGQDVQGPAPGELVARQRKGDRLVPASLVGTAGPEGDLTRLMGDQAAVGDRAAGQIPRQVLQDVFGRRLGRGWWLDVPRRPRPTAAATRRRRRAPAGRSSMASST